MKKPLLLIILAIMYGPVATAQTTAQSHLSSKRITEADFTGVWSFERAEYWGSIEKFPVLVLKERINSVDLLNHLPSFCLGEGIKRISFIGDAADVETLLMLRQQVEYRLQKSEEGSAWLELLWNNEAEGAPPMMFRYEIDKTADGLVVLTHDVLCHDSAGTMYQNILKMFLRINR